MVKKIIALVLVLISILTNTLVFSVTERVIHVDGKEIAFNSNMGYPIISNERTLVKFLYTGTERMC